MKLKYEYLIMLAILFGSCKKDLPVNNGTPDFDVSVKTDTYKVGDKIDFNFTGDANTISFFSGEVGRDYAFKDGRSVTAGALTLSFQTGVTGGTQANQFSVLASTDFNGQYGNFQSVKSATWTDITSRFALGTTATFLASGVKDISDLKVANKPLYLAFKYITRPQTTNGAARTWMLQSFALTTATNIGTLTVADMTNVGFHIVDQDSTVAISKSAVSATRLTMLGNTFTATEDPLLETWAVTTAFDVQNFDNGPDRPLAVKGPLDAKRQTYTYTYTKPGTYKVYFVASNHNVNEQLTTVRDVTITVTP